MEGNDNQDYFERTIIQIIGISYRITEFERQPVMHTESEAEL